MYLPLCWFTMEVEHGPNLCDILLNNYKITNTLLWRCCVTLLNDYIINTDVKCDLQLLVAYITPRRT